MSSSAPSCACRWLGRLLFAAVVSLELAYVIRQIVLNLHLPLFVAAAGWYGVSLAVTYILFVRVRRVRGCSLLDLSYRSPSVGTEDTYHPLDQTEDPFGDPPGHVRHPARHSQDHQKTCGMLQAASFSSSFSLPSSSSSSPISPADNSTLWASPKSSSALVHLYATRLLWLWLANWVLWLVILSMSLFRDPVKNDIWDWLLLVHLVTYQISAVLVKSLFVLYFAIACSQEQLLLDKLAREVPDSVRLRQVHAHLHTRLRALVKDFGPSLIAFNLFAFIDCVGLFNTVVQGGSTFDRDRSMLVAYSIEKVFFALTMDFLASSITETHRDVATAVLSRTWPSEDLPGYNQFALYIQNLDSRGQLGFSVLGVLLTRKLMLRLCSLTSAAALSVGTVKGLW